MFPRVSLGISGFAFFSSGAKFEPLDVEILKLRNLGFLPSYDQIGIFTQIEPSTLVERVNGVAANAGQPVAARFAVGRPL